MSEMVRIRTGAAWRHDPDLRAALRCGVGPDRAAAARGVVDALALEVDGVDIAAGLAEGPLLPTLEALLHAVARIVGGAPHATVTFPEGEVELLLRRRGRAVLLTVLALTRPSRVLARDVEVELDALAAAALDASAALCRELAELLPGAEAREARPLRAAARALRRTEEGAPPGPPRPARRAREPRRVRRSAPVSCVLELGDDDGLAAGYEGGRPDLGSLLGPGRVVLRAADGSELAAIGGIPFLVLRDLGGAADALLRAVRESEPRLALSLGRAGRGSPIVLEVDLASRTVAAAGAAAHPCPPLSLARAFGDAQAELGRAVRARNPRQAENAYVAELERAAAERLAQLEELEEGDRPAEAPAAARVPAPPRVAQRPLGPGRLRRLSFRPTFRLDAGAPAGEGLLRAGAVVIAAGAAAAVGLDARTGAPRWRAEGCELAAVAGGSVLLARGGALDALTPRSGRLEWTRPLPGSAPLAVTALARGPLVLVHGAALTALDPGSGRTLWRFEPPGAARLSAAAFGGVLAVAADTGLLYGLDATGRTLWRLRAPGPLLRAPVAAAGLCLALSVADPGTALLGVDPATGARRWEAPLDETGAPVVRAWGRRIAVAGTVGGDSIVTALERSGAAAWTAAPALSGPVSAVAAEGLLVVRDAAGGIVALGRDGAARWSRPPRPEHGVLRGPPPVVARGTVVSVAGETVEALDARTGELVGSIPGLAPVRLSTDASLGIAAMDADGLATGWRLATHLSVV